MYYRIWGLGLLILRLISMLGLGFPDNFNLRFRILGLGFDFSVTNNFHVRFKTCVWRFNVRFKTCVWRFNVRFKVYYIPYMVDFYVLT